jgi:hypothetical protein
MFIEYARVVTIKDNVSLNPSSLKQLKLSNTNIIHLNIKKKLKYQKNRTSSLLYNCRSLNNDNQALVKEYNTV